MTGCCWTENSRTANKIEWKQKLDRSIGEFYSNFIYPGPRVLTRATMPGLPAGGKRVLTVDAARWRRDVGSPASGRRALRGAVGSGGRLMNDVLDEDAPRLRLLPVLRSEEHTSE